MATEVPIAAVLQQKIAKRNQLARKALQVWFDELVQSLVNDPTKWAAKIAYLKDMVEKDSSWITIEILKYQFDEDKYEYPLPSELSKIELFNYLRICGDYKIMSQKIKTKNNFFTGSKIEFVFWSNTARVQVVLAEDKSCIIA